MRSTLICLLILCSIPLSAEELHGVITRVVDGNTVILATPDYEDLTILLKGIDSPESGQRFSDESRRLLENLLLGKRVSVQIHGKDRHGNRLAIFQVNGVDPRRELVKHGLAWTLEEDPELEAVREEARAQGKGIWEEADPTPPWIYRRQQAMLQVKSS
jgi:endonuclease YncB( thermonuclease family)